MYSGPRRKKVRLEKEFYNEGYFFVTANVQNRICCLSSIVDGRVVLSKLGNIVDRYWREINSVYTNVETMEYVIMQNHVYGIIKIIGADTIRPYYGMLSKVMKGFKQKVSKEIHKAGYKSFQRQKSFYDPVIVDEKSLQRVQEYIYNNPLKWEHDKYYDD